MEVVKSYRCKRPAEVREYLYYRNVVWSSDGVYCMAQLIQGKHSKYQLFQLPQKLFSPSSNTSTDASFSEWECLLEMSSNGANILDVDWFPGMNAAEYPESCIFASTTRDSSIKLFDICTGLARCSYAPYDFRMDEMIFAFSLRFTKDSRHLLTGCSDSQLHLFDIMRPGKESADSQSVYKLFKSRKAIVSSIAASWDNHNIFAAGSYAGSSSSIALGDLRARSDTFNIPVSYISDDIATKEISGPSGVTQIEFMKNCDGNYLISSYRNYGKIVVWDLRSPQEPFVELDRPQYTETNQRMYFGYNYNDHDDKHILAVGGGDGSVALYSDLKHFMYHCADKDFEAASCLSIVQSCHEDLISGLSVNTRFRSVVTCSGQRQFDDEAVSLVDPSVKVWSY